MINHDKYMMINFLIFYEFLYEKYYFLRKKQLKFFIKIMKLFIES